MGLMNVSSLYAAHAKSQLYNMSYSGLFVHHQRRVLGLIIILRPEVDIVFNGLSCLYGHMCISVRVVATSEKA